MTNQKDAKAERVDWNQRAHAVVDRPTSAAHPTSPTSNAEKTRRISSRNEHELAHEEWVKWAQIIVDRLAAVVPDFVPSPMPSRYSHQALPEKPARNEWTKWAQIVVDRLTTCVHIYSKPPYPDVFMSDKDRQDKNARTLDLLRRIHALTDDAGAPSDSLTDLEHHNERVLAGLSVLMKETLRHLPEISSDMQLLLKSPWLENCNGLIASELFIGPSGNESEGIGSGHPIHGRLPQALQDLIEREDVGHIRPSASENDLQAQNPRWHDEAHRRWSKDNSQSLRSAGRVE